MGTIYEADVDRFLPTPLSTVLVRPIYADGFPVVQEVVDPAVRRLHDCLSKNQYRNPSSFLESPFQLAHNTEDTFFQYLQRHPRFLAMFNNHMTATHASLSNWMNAKSYPFEKDLVKGCSEEDDAILFVDVGGGNGHHLMELCRQYPTVDKRMVLQDQASVIEGLANIKLDPRIQPMAHDFFTEQPIKGNSPQYPQEDYKKMSAEQSKGARAYYMSRIIHDWPDSKCREILTNLRSAMKAGYSKLLLYEHVIPDRGAQGNITGMDIIMMSLFGTAERTEHDWKSLLESVGFKIVKIWSIEPASESLIEAEII